MEKRNKNQESKTGEKDKDLSNKTKLEIKEADDPKGSEFSGIPGTGGEDKDLGTPAAGAGAAGTAGRGTSSKKRLE